MGPLFLTGASGFVGGRLTRRLAELGTGSVRCLARRPETLILPDPRPGGWEVVAGDLTDPAPWRRALDGVETVIHLAAATGKASRAVHLEQNLEATSHLVTLAREAGVRRFLFVSSIAAGFRDRRGYHYASAKAGAEAAVLGGRLEALVFRPTLVLGPGSPVLANLGRLASLPIPVMFGAGRPVQPVHVDDVAAAIAAALDAPRWSGEVVELGGPEAVEMPELMARIRRGRGLSARTPIRIPMEPLRTLLGWAEPVLLGVLPFTAGQLAAFANSSTAEPPPAALGLPAPRFGLDAMVAR